MNTLYQVDGKDLENLDALQLTQLLKKLLHLEARSENIPERGIDVGLKINVGDGGEDGRIEWSGGPASTNFLPARIVLFQNKAKEMGPKEYAAEIVGRDKAIKPAIKDVLQRNGAYVIFINKILNGQQKKRRKDTIRKKLRELGEPYADSANIEIYDAGTIQGWVNGHVQAITMVLNWLHRPIVPGLLRWEQWEELESNQPVYLNYVVDEARSKAIESIRNLSDKPRSCIRIIGLSGLGKTRLVLEACKGNTEADSFRDRVLYLDAAVSDTNLPGLLESWIDFGFECLFIVDNCALGLHKQLRRVILRQNSKLSLITLHYTTEKDDDTPLIRLETMSDEKIKAMLEPVYGEKISDLDRIVRFAQGFPQMAVLLVKARLDKTVDMGRLTNDELAKKMLWGNKSEDKEVERILQACSLFDKFGLEEETEDEADFIANKIADTNLDDLYKCVRKYEITGIVNRAGRYAQIIPKPLAIRLAAEWWTTTRRPKQIALINTEMPGQLERSFCDQISKLDFLPEVKELTKNLCGNQGPFGQAEVILSGRGSLLFRSLVEVNPEATSDAIYRILHDFSCQQLLRISGDTRRNLVWALEKLCFHKNVFEKSAKCLLWLASAENETWANNATGQFLQLFRTFLSGTEAPPESRLLIIEFALKQKDESTRLLAVKALGAAVDPHGGSRTVGAEYQGSGQPLMEWRPRIWNDAFSYWIACIKQLTILARNDTNVGNAARDTLGQHIRGLAQTGIEVVRALDKAIKEIVSIRGPLWPTALDSIKTAMSFDMEKMPVEMKRMYETWVELLKPEKLEDKIALIVSIPPYEHGRDVDGHFVDIAAINAEEFAKTLSNDVGVLMPAIRQLLIGEQRQAYWFGRTLVLESKNWEPLLSMAIKLMQELESPNISFVMGLLSGLNEVDQNEWGSYIDLFYKNKLLNKYYPDVIQTGQIQINHLNTIIELMRSGVLQENRATVLTFGRALDNLDAEIVTEFARNVSLISVSGGWIAIDILSMYCYKDDAKWERCLTTFKDILINLPLDENAKHQQFELHHWKEAVLKILESEDKQFAISLTDVIVSSELDKIGYINLRHYIKPVMRFLLKNYGNDTWPRLADAINSAPPSRESMFINLLNKEDGFSDKQSSVLAELPEQLLRDWCDALPNKAPFFLARTIAVYLEENDQYIIAPIAKFLIDKFGDNTKLLNVLSSNMSSFGWSGSVVPRYEKEIAALEPFRRHKRQNVRDWAETKISYLEQAIKREKMFDEERELGIY